MQYISTIMASRPTKRQINREDERVCMERLTQLIHSTAVHQKLVADDAACASCWTLCTAKLDVICRLFAAIRWSDASLSMRAFHMCDLLKCRHN